MNRLLIVILLITVNSLFAIGQDCKCDFIIDSGEGYVDFDGTKNNVQPGQVICFIKLSP